MPTCVACSSWNGDGTKFCEDCGSPLTANCSSCGSATTPGKRFCGSCGAELDSPSPEPVAEAPQPLHAPVAERRVCSVLFCDLVGFTALSEKRDPEEVRELLSRYFELAHETISRYGGTVEKFIGDAVMAVWGTPTATEQDGERAVRAALELVESVDQLGRDIRERELAARAGVVTSPVAVTVAAAGQGMVAGDAVNTAARVQAAAPSGAVLVDEGTWQVSRAAIDMTAAGTYALKGKAEPIPLWRANRVLSGIGGAQRTDGLEAQFVGRDAELRTVKELFHACEQRHTPRLVSITGAAGVGKSRLGWEFEKYVDGLADTVLWHRGRCLSYGDGVAFWALTEMVRQRLGIADEDSTATANDKLTSSLNRWLPDAGEQAYVRPRLAQLLGTDPADSSTPLGREELFAGWRLFLERLAAVAPVVLLVDDLQYADQGLLDFFEHVLEWASGASILVFTMARPELEARRPGWGAGRRNSTALTLGPLDDIAMDSLLEDLLPGVPAAGKAAVAGRAEGNPLYAVETVRMLIDRGAVQPIDGGYRLVGDVGELSVPATLQSLLAARLDALGPSARQLVADAAVLGGTFPAEALVAVSDQPEPQVRLLLADLLRREVFAVRADPLSPQLGQYAFVQSLFRQVAYHTLSRRERKARHLAVAAHLEGASAAGGEEVAEVIAAHLLDALRAVPEDPDVAAIRNRAVAMLTRAGERADRTGAPASAAAAYVAAADLLEQATDEDNASAAAAQLERAGHSGWIAADFAVAEQRFRRAAEIYRRLALPRDAARADIGISKTLGSGRHDEGRALLRQALSVLEAEADGDTVEALGQLAFLEILSGDPAEGERLSIAALALAQALDQPDSALAHLLTIRGSTHRRENRLVEAAAYFREAARRAEKADDSSASAFALLMLAWVMWDIDPADAVQAGRAAVAHARRIGDYGSLGAARNNLVQALLLAGDWDDAEEVVNTGFSIDGLDDHAMHAFGALLLRYLRGDSTGVAALTESFQAWAESEDSWEAGTFAATQAVFAATEENWAEVLMYAERSLSYTDDLGLASESTRWPWPIAADAALALNAQHEVIRLLAWLDKYPRGHLPPILRAERLRIRARLLAAESDPAAGEEFDLATKACREVGSPYHLAVCLLDQAAHLDSVGDQRTGAQLAAEAGVIANQLGATVLLERAQRVSVLKGDRNADKNTAAKP